MKKKSKIRVAKEADFEVINSLYYENYSDIWANLPESYNIIPKKLLPKGTFLNMLEDKNAIVLAAEINNQVVGFIYATIEKADGDDVVKGYNRISVDELTIKSDYQRKGIGTLLIEEVEKWARANKINDLITLTYAYNKNAIKFYESNGFKPYSIQLDKKV